MIRWIAVVFFVTGLLSVACFKADTLQDDRITQTAQSGGAPRECPLGAVVGVGRTGECLVEMDDEGRMVVSFPSGGTVCTPAAEAVIAWRELWSLSVGDPQEVRAEVSLDPNRFRGGGVVALICKAPTGAHEIWYVEDPDRLDSAEADLNVILSSCETGFVFEIPDRWMPR